MSDDIRTIYRCVHCMGKLESDGIEVCPHCGKNPSPAALVQPDYCIFPMTILHGKYLVGKSLGHGGFGITYIGLDLFLDIKVAIKECFPDSRVSRIGAQSNTVMWSTSISGVDTVSRNCENFLREAKKMARIKDIKGIVRVLDTFTENNTAYIIMDYVDGMTVTEKLHRDGKMAPDECVEFFRPIMQALSEVHKLGFVHRDISPDNIMVDSDGSLKILDLGAAKDLTGSIGGGSAAATTTAVIRSGFSPAEQYSTSGNIGSWTDVYALSATMYYCMTGKKITDSLARLDGATIDFDPKLFKKPPTEEIKQALIKGLEVNYKDRTMTMVDFEESFKGKKRGSRNAIIAAIAALFVICIAVGIAHGFYTRPDPAPFVTTAATTPEVITTTEPEPEPPTPSPDANFLMVTKNVDADGNTESPLAKFNTVEKVTFRDTLKDAPDSAVDYSVGGDNSVMIWKDGKELIIAADGKVRCYDTSYLFGDFAFLKEADLSGLDTSAVTSMRRMFSNCTALEEVDLGSFDTSNVTDMNCMFCECAALTSIDVSEFDTSNVTDMFGMFYNCSSLPMLDVSGFDTSKVTNMRSMFYNCSSLEALYVSGFDTSNVTDMSYLFYNCSSLEALDVGGFDTSKVTNMRTMFFDCSLLGALDVSGFDTSNVTDMSYLFQNCSSLEALDVGGFDTSKVTNMHSMFFNCSSLEALDVSGFDTSNVTDMYAMFHNCSSLKRLDVGGFDTSNVTDMYCMFYNCSSLKNLDVSGFDTSKVTNLGWMFADCKVLEGLDVSGFVLSNATDMQYFVQNCPTGIKYHKDEEAGSDLVDYGSEYRLTASFDLDGLVTLSWLSTHAEKYYVYLAEYNDGIYRLHDIVNVDGDSDWFTYNLGGLDDGKYYSVFISDGVNASEKTMWFNKNQAKAYDEVSTPTYVMVQNIGNSVYVAWQPIQGANSYKVFYSNPGDDSFFNVESFKTTNTNMILTGLKTGQHKIRINSYSDPYWRSELTSAFYGDSVSVTIYD